MAKPLLDDALWAMIEPLLPPAKPRRQRYPGRKRLSNRQTLTGMVERDGNHPSIGIWTIINEGWGIDLTDPSQRAWLAETYEWLKSLDPTRLVVGNSACWGNFHVTTDIADFHIYYAMPDHHRRCRDDFDRGRQDRLKRSDRAILT